jgi:predicted nucleic acid-binding protein
MKDTAPKKIIADTSIWIEFLKNNPKIFSNMRVLLEKNHIIAVECIFGELLQGTISKREREVILSYWNCLPKINEISLWIDAGIYSNQNKLISKGIGLIDSMIIISALKNDLLVWTLDKKINNTLDSRFKY